MTDLQIILTMLSKTDHEFEKRKSGEKWQIILSNDIEYNFHKDESLQYIYNQKLLPCQTLTGQKPSSLF